MKAGKSNRSLFGGKPWRFLLRFVIFFAVIYLLWSFTAPLANKPFTFIGGNIVMLFDGANYTKAIKAVGRYIVVAYEPTVDRKTLTMEYKGFTFNTVFLLALIMAVPNVDYKLRLRILILGLLLLYPIQIFRLVIHIFEHYCKNIRLKSGAFIYPAYMHHSLAYIDRVLIRIDGQIIPVVIWAGLFYYYKWHNIFTKVRKGKARTTSEPK